METPVNQSWIVRHPDGHFSTIEIECSEAKALRLWGLLTRSRCVVWVVPPRAARRVERRLDL